MATKGNSTKRAQYPNYALCAARLSTFRGWPEDKSQTPEEMAEAGFFYTGMLFFLFFGNYFESVQN